MVDQVGKRTSRHNTLRKVRSGSDDDHLSSFNLAGSGTRLKRYTTSTSVQPKITDGHDSHEPLWNAGISAFQWR